MMTNADPQELAKFGDLAHKWWDPESEFRPLHEINPLRLDWIDQLSAIRGKKVLDVGCGGGILAESMARRGADVLGIDMGEAPLAVGRLHAQQENVQNIEYRQIPVEELAQQQAGQYDVVTCMEMMEHVPDPASIVKSCQTLVKPGGHVFFSTINRNPKSYLMAVIGAEYVLQLLPRGTHDYAKFIKPAELARFARDASLVSHELAGVHYNPLNRSFRIGRDTSVNYM